MKTDMINILPLLPYLGSEKRIAEFLETVNELEQAVDAGFIRNSKLSRAKEHINYSVDKIGWAYNEQHGYGFDKVVSSAHDVPSALKLAIKKNDTGRVALFSALLPIAELLKAAKPLAVKKQDAGPTDRQQEIAAERAGHEMTCQCCSRKIFANAGSIAHHGYQRPGDGWQTASCWGAKRLPWEVDRTALGELIAHLTTMLGRLIESRDEAAAEIIPVVHHYQVYDRTVKGGYRYGKLTMTRDTFDNIKAANVDGVFTHSSTTFDQFKTRDLDKQDTKIRQIRRDIAEFTRRYAGWKQTHKREGDQWVALTTTKEQP